VEQQERALTAYLESVRDQPGVLAVVAVGSLARGTERPDSDVDVYLIVDDQRFRGETSAGRFAWVERRDADYPGSYIDVKLASPSYLEAAIQRADDPTRASFAGARVAFSRLPGLESVIERIAVLPDEVWEERVRSHVAQARLYGGYFLPQAVERGDVFLRQHAGLHLSLAAARAALAASKTLMPGPKYISSLVRSVPTPDGFVEAWDRVVTAPDVETAAVLMGILDEWLGRDLVGDEALSVFIRDNELSWLRGTMPAEFW
jgi:predicted nucleotidyltransferase